MTRLNVMITRTARALALLLLLLACSPAIPEAAPQSGQGTFEGLGVYFTAADVVDGATGALVYLPTYSHLALFGLLHSF